ncbi:MAG: hypothetical protein LBU73_08555 [Helicobacteraceae bacterium]|jgi:hypothetical protein|nr:hypothetical protein [Helicobacteraceae bacterium]
MKKFLFLPLIFFAASCALPKDAGLPPDPGFFTSRSTLEGIDANNNGIRDDVEIKIYKWFPERKDIRKRKALEQQAIWYQKAIIVGDALDQKEAKELHEEMSRSVSCMHTAFNDLVLDWRKYVLEWQKYGDKLEGAMINTEERSEAYWYYNALLSGDTYRDKEEYTFPCLYDEELNREIQEKYKNMAPEEINPDLPPDPGEEGKATLVGIDRNENGVRDDAERAIWKYAPLDIQIELREAMLQLAKGYQKIILAGASKDIDEIEKANVEYDRADRCMAKQKTTKSSDFSEHYLVDTLMLNTREREWAEIYFRKAKKEPKRDNRWDCDYTNTLRNQK